MASSTAATTGPTTISKLRASLARFPAEIAAADAEGAAKLRAAQKKAERELVRLVELSSDRLIEAARRDDVGAARVALEGGANPNRPIPTVEGWDADEYDVVADEAMLSALGWAVNRGSQEMAMLLIDRGSANPNQACTADGHTALMEAAEIGYVEVTQLLLDRSADPNQANDNGHTALMCAADGGHLEVTRLLLDRSAVPNQACTDTGSTALMGAAAGGHLEVTRLLLDRSADPSQVQPDDGATVLMWAAEAGHVEVVQLVLFRPS